MAKHAKNIEGDKGAWALYDELIEGVPADVMVTDYALGVYWSYVNAESGCGIAWTARGGVKGKEIVDWRGRSLRDMAALAKSWCFEDATLGVAALNAWYGREENLLALGAVIEGSPEAAKLCAVEAGEGVALEAEADGGAASGDMLVTTATVTLIDDADGGRRHAGSGRDLGGFELRRPELEAFAEAEGRLPRVAVVGHFPHMEQLAEYTDLTVLERNVRSDLDTPDPACEYVLPACDFAFVTGVTLINKTAPRILQLAENCRLTMVGPSVVASPALIDRGVGLLAGRYVVDPERVRFSCTTGFPFGSALRNYAIGC